MLFDLEETIRQKVKVGWTDSKVQGQTDGHEMECQTGRGQRDITADVAVLYYGDTKDNILKRYLIIYHGAEEQLIW